MSRELAIENHENVQIMINGYIKDKQSFFVIAGAGAGKTKSLVDTLKHIKKSYKAKYLPEGRRVAVITYTENAAEEIQKRVGEESIFRISTIHSFAWEVISKYKKHLLNWVKKNTTNYPNVKSVEYTLQKSTEDIYRLKHNEVINAFQDMLEKYDLLKNIVTKEYPLILVDEYQDTEKRVIDILLDLNSSDDFTLGFFGDPMQRIYYSGYSFLEDKLAECGFKKIEKVWNWRSSYEIVHFINRIRNINTNPNEKLSINTGNFSQKPVSSKKSEKRPVICIVDEEERPQKIERKDMKTLVLEHRMAAERLGFSRLYDLFHADSDKKVAFKEGNIPSFKSLIKPTLDLYMAKENVQSRLHIMKYMRNYNLYFQDTVGNEEKIKNKIKQLSNSYTNILNLMSQTETTLRDYIENIKSSELFYLSNEINFEDSFWEKVGKVPLQEFIAYLLYMEDMDFITQHGSKGLEYDKVQVILSQKEARGRLHNFNQLFRIEKLSKSIFKNNEMKKDNTLTRTQKLLYVAVSRAKKELRIIWYVPKEKIQQVKKNMRTLFQDVCDIE